jgi:hypothetical protein
MTNKDLLVLENEFRDELPRYKEKPKIAPVEKPTQLTARLSSFLASAAENQPSHPPETLGTSDTTKMVEMDIYITPTNEE